MKYPTIALLKAHLPVCPSENFVTKVEKSEYLCPMDTFLVTFDFILCSGKCEKKETDLCKSSVCVGRDIV